MRARKRAILRDVREWRRSYDYDTRWYRATNPRFAKVTLSGQVGLVENVRWVSR